MLKIGSVRFRGKCPRHPRFDPALDGRAGIRGGCEKCLLLADIHEHHTRMVGMMRKFSPPREASRRPRGPDLQTSFFAEFEREGDRE